MFRSIVLGGALLALLAACTDSSITEVKKSSISQSDFTYGEALDDAKGCKSTEWNRHDDGNGRPVVEYTCTAEMSSKLIENAKAENIVRVKEMIKAYDIEWQRIITTLETRKNEIEQTAVRTGANQEAKLKQFNGQLQEAQENLNRTLASSPETYIGHGPSGYTPALLEQGRGRMELAINNAQQRIGAVQRQIEATKQAQSEPAEAGYQFAPGQYRSASDYQTMLDGMRSWKDRYIAAVNQSEAEELKKAEEFLSANKDRKLQLKITFLVNKKSPVVIQSIKWVYDGKDDRSVAMVHFAVILMDPKRMPELLEIGLKSRLRLEIDSSKNYASFPFTCSEQIPTGCELRKPAT